MCHWENIFNQFYMLTIFLKNDVYGVSVPQFQLAYICDISNTLYNNLIHIFRYVHYMCWASGGQESTEGEGYIGEAGEDTGTGGGGPEGVMQFLYCRDTAGPPLRGGDMGAD